MEIVYIILRGGLHAQGDALRTGIIVARRHARVDVVLVLVPDACACDHADPVAMRWNSFGEPGRGQNACNL